MRTVEIRLRNQRDITIARGEGKDLAEALGFSAADTTAIEIAILELGSNVIRYAGEGGITVSPVVDGDNRGIEMVCTDSGPGIHDIDAVMEGRNVSEQGLGIGLSGAKRLMDDFEISSSTEGTRIVVRKWLRVPHISSLGRRPVIAAIFAAEEHVLDIRQGTRLRIAAVTRPSTASASNGDAYLAVQIEKGVLFGLIDGLGHGDYAARASTAATDSITQHAGYPLRQILRICHRDLEHTRGAVAGIAKLDAEKEELTYCGVGNIEARIIGEGEARHPFSMNGIVGHNLKEPRELVFRFSPGDLMVLHSDGISQRFRLTPGDATSDELLSVARRIAAEHGHEHDDATIMLIRWEEVSEDDGGE